MKAAEVLNTKAGQTAVAVLVGGVVIYFLFRKFGGALGEAAKGAADAVGRVNEGTPYAGFGVVGTLGHGVDRVSGGMLSSLGSWLGGAAFDLLHKDYDPNNPRTPQGVHAATRRSPTRPEDKPTLWVQ